MISAGWGQYKKHQVVMLGAGADALPPLHPPNNGAKKAAGPGPAATIVQVSPALPCYCSAV